ncbi:MAG: hypothetical protein C0502_09285 [Opitutus sp.]|nr:hypothetical protein [Opitutus sp.]
MNRPDQAWRRLAAAARRAPDEGEPAAPCGFATRVAALGLTDAPLPAAVALLEKFALRGLLAAAACSVAAAAFGYSAFSAEQEYETVTGDLVTEILAQS